MKNRQEHKYLNYTNRTKEINAKIDHAYEKISKHNASEWGLYNGKSQYKMFIASETYLLQNLINNNKEQKEFYILEVGAGNFQFGKYLAEFINQQINDGKLPKDITVNIISTRGEKNLKNPYFKDGNCQLWEFGNFKIENLIEEFKNKGLGDLNGKFDLIMSNYTLRHLVDPLGTFLQMHDLVKKGGIILTDTFKFKVQDYQNSHAHNATGILLSYLHDAGDEILVKKGRDDRSYPAIAVRKQGEDVKIPLNYSYYTEDYYHNSYYEVFSSNEAPKNYANKLLSKVYLTLDNIVVGNKSLFTLLAKALLPENHMNLSQKEKELSDNLTLQKEYKKYISIFNEQDDIPTFDEYEKTQHDPINWLKEEIESLESGDYLKTNHLLDNNYMHCYFVNGFDDEATPLSGVTEGMSAL